MAPKLWCSGLFLGTLFGAPASPLAPFLDPFPQEVRGIKNLVYKTHRPFVDRIILLIALYTHILI